MRRISVVGSPGSGKSTLSAALAERLEVPHIELDAFYHQADWEPRPQDEFRAEIRGLMEAPAWIVDGNYGSRVRDLVWAEVDTVIWLDLSKIRVMASVFRRTLGRVFGRKLLWNENRERLRNLFASDPVENLLLWTWTHFDHYRDTYSAASVDPSLSHIEFVQLRSRPEIRRWLNDIGT